MISKDNFGWLFSNFPHLQFLIAFTSLLPWIQPSQRTHLPSACMHHVRVHFHQRHRGHSSTAGWGPLISSLTASQMWLQTAHYLPLCDSSIFPNLSWQGLLDGLGDTELKTREGNTWNGIFKEKNEVSARRTRQGKVGPPEMLHNVSPVEFHTASRVRA